MNNGIGKIVVDVARTLGKAVLAGAGLELAKVASDHLRRRLGPKDPPKEGEPEKDERTPEEIRAENARLKTELERVREELDAARRAHRASATDNPGV